MTNNIKNICVFASSSVNLNEIYYKEARRLGLLMGQTGYNIVYGGSRRGLMYACAGAVKEQGGTVCGVMPEKLANLGFANPDDCNEFIITPGMRERKAIMDKKSDAVIALAGGYGTVEELTEMIVQKQLGYNSKPIVILNTNNFYNSLIRFFEETISQNFANSDSGNLYYTCSTAEEAIEYIQHYSPVEIESKFSINIK